MDMVSPRGARIASLTSHNFVQVLLLDA